MKNIFAIFARQFKDTLKNRMILLQFIMFPLITVLMEGTVATEELTPHFFAEMFSVMYIGMAMGSVLLGPLADRYSPKLVLTGSLVLTGLGCSIMALFTKQTPVLLLMLSLGILGLGLGGNGTIFMKVVLSGLSQSQAGAGTGTYGLFRDLAAPFGVAVLVPLYTNGIAGSMARGLSGPAAAVETIRLLALVEVICVAAGIAAVRLLPETGSASK